MKQNESITSEVLGQLNDPTLDIGCTSKQLKARADCISKHTSLYSLFNHWKNLEIKYEEDVYRRLK